MTRPLLQRSVWFRCSLVALVFIVLLAICLAALPVESDVVFLIFFPGLAATALFCGVGPGLLFLTLSSIASSYLFFRLHGNVEDRSVYLTETAEFIASAFFTLGVVHFFRRQAEDGNRRLDDEISERHYLEAQSAETSARLAAIFDSAMDAIISVDISQRVVLFNLAAEKMFGYPAAEMIGSSIARLVPERFRQSHGSSLERFAQEPVLHRKTTTLDELYGLRSDGSEFPIEASISLTVVDRSPLLTVIMRDVSDRLAAEQALNTSRRQLTTLIDQMPVSVAMLDNQMNFIATSERWLTEHGYGQADLTGFSYYAINTDYKEEWKRIHQDALNGFATECDEDHWLKEDGSKRWVRWAVRPWTDDRGAVGGIIILIEDITVQALTEIALREREEDLVRAQSVGDIGSWKLDVRLNVLTWSAENYRIFGIPPDTPLTYQCFLERVHPEDREYVDSMWRACLDGAPYDIEHRLLIDGETKWVREKAELEYDDKGELVGGFGITQDITEKRLARNELNEARDRLAAVAEERQLHLQQLSGELVRAEQKERDRIYELLHDEVQPLLVAARLGLSGLSEKTPPADSMRVVADANAQISEVVETMRTLSRELNPPLVRDRGLLPALESLCRWVRVNHGLEVTLNAMPDAEPPSVTIRLLFFNAIRELLMNVVKYAKTWEATIDLTTEAPNLLRATVRDEGIGFDPAQVSLGSGLSNQNWRLGMVGGELRVQSAPGSGTIVTLVGPIDMRGRDPERVRESVPGPESVQKNGAGLSAKAW
ncbi:MAG: PAS domain S-box protein [Propionivibrio sp.]